MARFIQIHALTVYPPSNLNRDDSGRPKTAHFGGVERLRISSQALKRAVRTSASFTTALAGHIGTRTARFGDELRDKLVERNFEPARALAIACVVASLFGKPDETAPEGKVLNKELFFMAPEERASLIDIMEKIAADKDLADELAEAAGTLADEGAEAEGETDDDSDKKKKPKKDKAKAKGLSKDRIKELRDKVLVTSDTAVDIAMFGRMLASAPEFNREAAVQIAHALTTHKADLDDDFYTAVDDLKTRAEDAGAGFIGELQFGSGVFYIYACIDRDLLEKNLGGNDEAKALAARAIAALVEGLATASPSGKQNSFASRARASYLRVEKGPQQPRTLAAAFLKPVRDHSGEGSVDLLRASIDRIEAPKTGLAEQMIKAYGDCYAGHKIMRFIPGADDNAGSLDDLKGFAAE